MKKSEILAKVQGIFIDVLDNEEIKLTDETTADDVDEWDSLSHIQLVVTIEKQLRIKFTSKEILFWKNVGEMIDCIAIKLENA
ncbi:acyl carrier protein [Bacteroidales bacterium Barb4]|nr:acyl carrier protein [Bacteroidales bacterium Barb4]